MSGYELAFWIAVVIIAAMIFSIVRSDGRESKYPPEHPHRWCDAECHSLGGHRYLDMEESP